MPIAFKEWAVTVRALAEGEQLVTLRKGGIREPDRHFALDLSLIHISAVSYTHLTLPTTPYV